MEYAYSDLDFKLADRYTACVLSMDTLYKADAAKGDPLLASEGLVPVLMSEFPYKQMESWEEIKSNLEDIYRQYTGIENDIRKSYMLEQVASVITLGEWTLGKKEFTYRQLVQNLLFLNHNPVSEKQLSRVREDLGILLANSGYRGSFKEKLTAWKNDVMVQPADLQTVLDDNARRLREKAVDIGFEEVADVEVKCVVDHDLPFSGYCDFMTRTIIINGDMEYTYPGVKRLMAHETHPGHMTHMQLRKLRADKGLIPSDALLVITNTASSGIFEGLADNGLLFTGQESEQDDQIARLYNNYNAMLSVTMAHRIHEEKVKPEDAVTLLKESLYVTEAAAKSKMRFLTFPLRTPFTYCYWRGNEQVRQMYSGLPKSEAWEFLKFAYGNMHSVNSLRQFI